MTAGFHIGIATRACDRRGALSTGFPLRFMVTLHPFRLRYPAVGRRPSLEAAGRLRGEPLTLDSARTACARPVAPITGGVS